MAAPGLTALAQFLFFNLSSRFFLSLTHHTL
jgi:hypothetical protein